MFEAGLVHRPYIDGLRAVAVLLVLFFHIDPAYFPGGYLGVDIFFVISGFVITQSLFKDYLKNNRIHIADFYIKRFKRLYPALLAMVFITTVAYIFFGFQWDTNLYLKSAVSSIFAVSNLYFLFQGSNYFHQDLINPLLHTWSLGIEEQFYIIYPLFIASTLWVLSRKKWNPPALVLGQVLLAVSILLYVGFSLGSGTIFGEYYFPFARFWELGIGCALFFFSYHFSIHNWGRILPTIGIGVLALSQVFQPNIANVYIETLLASLASAAIIYGGLSARGVIQNVLEIPIVVYVGKISYSLYLWHLPIIYFANLYLEGFSFYAVSIFGSFICAIISYHYIEHPLRHLEVSEYVMRNVRRVLLYIAGFAILILVLIASMYGVQVRKFVNDTFNIASKQLSAYNYIESQFHLGERMQPLYSLGDKDVSDCLFLKVSDKQNSSVREDCFLGKIGGTVIFLTGDSHASHLLPAIELGGPITATYFERFPRVYVADESVSENERSSAMIARSETLQVLSNKYDRVLHVLSFFLDQPQYEPSTVSKYLESYISMSGNNVDIILVAPTPVFDFGPISCVILGKHCDLDKTYSEERRSGIITILNKLAATNDRVYLYDPYDFLCPGDTHCIIYDAQKDFLLYMDDDHLSIEGSEALSGHFEAWLKENSLVDSL